MTDPKQATASESSARNQGEGDREAARRYNDSAREFTDSDAGKRARAEKPDLSEAERKQAERAEREGESRAREKDPQVSRDYSKAQD